MVASQLVVRRTFLEMEGCGLKDRVLELRRSRCMSDGMIELDSSFGTFVEKSKEEKICWDDMTDDETTDADTTRETSSSDESGDEFSLASFPMMPQLAGPPGVFVQNEESSRRVKAKRVGLWNAPAEQETRTTVLLRNVLTTSKRSDLCLLLNSQGFRGQYDFLYVPANFKTMLSFGYAFVNFVSGQAADAARQYFNGFQWSVKGESSVLETSWSNPHQGYEVHVERYRDCPVMHSSVADEYKPIVLQGGVRVPFPSPTKRLIAPRDVRRRHGA